ncbi:MAG: hypothetical protein NTW38_03580, partial [Candidatus Aminicenantes bacterium]|nr:hypothetical protein [Candidatus Aminicenantes bacterium]
MLSSAPISDSVFLDKFRRVFKNASILGLAQIGGLAVYLLVAEVIRAKQRPFLGFLSSSLTAKNRPVLRYAFYAAAIGILLLLRFIRGRRLRKIEALDDRGR